MAESAQKLQRERLARAVEIVAKDLAGDSAFESISANEAPELLATCPAVWRKTLNVSDKQWPVYVGLPVHFPDEFPIACVRESRDLLFKNPHIDERGFICTIPNSASTNAMDPAGLVRYVFNDAEKILSGTGLPDFQNEFTSYWSRSATLKEQPVFLIDPIEELGTNFSAKLCKGCICIAVSLESINRWITNRTGKSSTLDQPTAAIAVHRDAPLLPGDYPNTVADLISVARNSDLAAAQLIEEHLMFGSQDGVALLVQKEGDGVALGGIVFPVLGRAGLNSPVLMSGFRPGHVPKDLLLKRTLAMMNSKTVQRAVIHRVDHRWIHSRGGDGRNLSKKSVLLIGCGSLGGYVAHLLSRAGVGSLTMTDNDFLSWDNLGRHILGASFVGRSKAEALAEQLTRELPHLRIKGIPVDWRDALNASPNLLAEHDLIISTTGDWRCERPLNEMTHRTQTPPLILAWLEPHAVAGHCLVITTDGGCFECRANEFGHFLDAAAEFENPPLSREPGGCAHYQQYGPTALMPVASMVASTAIDCLLDAPRSSYLNTWISNTEHFRSVSARLAAKWQEKVENAGNSRIFRTPWEKSASCVICTRENS